MRSDGDSWDIVSSVGRTALAVATFRAVEDERPVRLVGDPFARMFVEASGERQFIDMLANPGALGGKMMPLMGVRTKFFDEFFLAATGAGARQAVILAAGLDARAFRLQWPAGTTVFEIDQPAVLEFKDRVLTENAAQPTADRRAVAVDLREDWPAALRAAGFDPTVPTAWSAEGLLSFLPGAAQDAMFERIDAASAAGSQIAANEIPAGTDFAQLRERAMQHFDHHPMGEHQASDLVYDDTRADPVSWLGEHGWIVHQGSAMQLLASFGISLPDLSEAPADLVDLGQRFSFWSAVKSDSTAQ